MNRLNKILLVFSCLCVCLLCFSIFKCRIYKREIIQLKKNEIPSDTLTPIDRMVLTGQDQADLICNSIYHYGDDDTPISRREYLLYCYIFAVRDKNPFAASEFSTLCMMSMENGNMTPDTAMLRMVLDFSQLVLSSQCNDSNGLIEWLAAVQLEKIYSGILCEEMKDSLLRLKYSDVAKKMLRTEDIHLHRQKDDENRDRGLVPVPAKEKPEPTIK